MSRKKKSKKTEDVEVQEEVVDQIQQAAEAFGAFDDTEEVTETEEDAIQAATEELEAEEIEAEGSMTEVDESEAVEMEAAGEESEDFSNEEIEKYTEEQEEDLIEHEDQLVADASLSEGSELEGFESAEIEEEEFVSEDELESIIEGMLFATDRPQSLTAFKNAFKGTNVKTKHIKAAIERLTIEYASPNRGVTLEEVTGGYQLRTKVDNMEFLKRIVKARQFKLSGPALEVLSIVAYKQPCVKSHVDEIRGVESGHLLRGLMDRSLVCFEGKSELPGKPMLYGTTKKFLEIFGLRNLQELPSLTEIDELIPEGIGDEEEKESLDMITDSMSEEIGHSYSEGEEELSKITDTLSDIDTSSEFFEEEKRRMKAKREAEKARDIREAIEMGDEVSNRDRNWLERYDLALQEQAEQEAAAAEAATEESSEGNTEDVEVTEGELEVAMEASSEELEPSTEKEFEEALSDLVEEVSASEVTTEDQEAGDVTAVEEVEEPAATTETVEV